MSEYKMRSQRRKRQSYAPYHTKKEESIVSRVWGWLAPSSWWPGATTGPPPLCDPSHPPSPHPPSPSHDHSSTDIATAASTKPSLMVTESSGSLTEPSGSLADMEQGQLNGMGPDEDSSSSWVAEDEVGTHEAPPTTRQTGLSVAKTPPGPAPCPAPSGLSVEKMVNPAFSRDPRHALSPPQFDAGMKPASGFTSHVLRSRPLLTSTPQLSPVSEANEERQPRLGPDDHHHNNGYHGNRNSHHGNQMGSRMIPNSVASPLPPVLEQSAFHTAPPSVSGASAIRHHQHYTDLSLSRSPFQSPFYSGRTSFGGAASGQRLRSVKRPRMESSPPLVASVQMTVTARPCSLAPPTSLSSLPAPSLPLSSSTARKILHTLDSLSSPLTHARRLPLRGANRDSDSQSAHKSHKSARGPALSPPPIAPLSTPSLNPSRTPSLSSPRPPSHGGPVIVPNEKSLRQTTTRQSALLGATLRPDNTDSAPAAVSVSSTSTTSKGQRSLMTSSASSQGQLTALLPPSSSLLPPSTSSSLLPPSTSSSLLPPSTSSSLLPPSTSSKLASLKFSAPSLSSLTPAVSPDHSNDTTTGMASGAVKFTPTFHTSSPLATSGGKVRLQRSSRTHLSHHHDNQEEVGVPVAMVPQVGLKLKSDSPPVFGFAKAIMPQKPASTVAVLATKTPPNYSFSSPKPLTSDALSQAPSERTSFQFSAPNPLTPSKATQQVPSRHSPSQRQATPPAPPLKSISVVDILKRPDYQALTNKSLTIATSQASNAVVDLTGEGEVGGEREGQTLPSLVAAGPPLPAITALPPASLLQSSDPPPPSLTPPSLPSSVGPLPLPASSTGWECTTCLIRNKGKDDKCIACGTANKSVKSDQPESLPAMPVLPPLGQLSSAQGGWECPTCMLHNKTNDSNCVACSAPKPGGVATCNLATTSKLPTLKFGAQGGLQLGSDVTTVGGAGHIATPPLKPLAQFAPPEGGWSCDTCMVDNTKTASSCVACGTARSAAGQQAPPTGSLRMGEAKDKEGVKFSEQFGSGGLKLSDGGLKLGGGGLKLGDGGLKLGGGGLKLGGSGLKLDGGGLKLGGGGLKLDGGGLKLDGRGLKLGGGGLKLGSGGLKLWAPVLTAPEKTEPLPVPVPKGGWECSTCLVHNLSDRSTCVACGGRKPAQQLVSESDTSLVPFHTAKSGRGSTAGTGMGFPSMGSVGGTGLGLQIAPAPANPLAGLKFGPSPSATAASLTTPSLAAGGSGNPSLTTPSLAAGGSGNPTAAFAFSVSQTARPPVAMVMPASTASVPAPFSFSNSVTTKQVPPAFTGGLGRATTTATAFTGGLGGATTTATAFTGGLGGATTTATAFPGGLGGATTTATAFTGGLGGATTTATAITGGLGGATTTATAFTGGLGGATTVFPGGLGGVTTTSSSMFRVVPAPSLSFGVATSDTGLSGFQFGTGQPPAPTTQPQPVFQFGQASSQAGSTSSSMFTFSGANPSTGQASLPPADASGQSCSTGFSFSGASSTAAHGGFGGGASSTAAHGGFGGGATAAHGGFGGGAGLAATSRAPSFAFGQAGTSFPAKAAPVFQPPGTGQTSQTSMFTAGVGSEGSRGGRVIRRARRRKA